MNESGARLRARLRQRFDRAAPHYDRHAGVQQEIASRLLERLELVRLEPRCIIDLGAGTGASLGPLRQRYPRARLMAVDFSHAMLAQAHRAHRTATAIAADAFQLPFAANSIDLVFSSSTLQWCLPLADVLQEIRRILRPAGLLMFSTYGPDTLRELRAAQQAAGLPSGINEFSDMHPIGDLLVEQAYQDPVLDVERLNVSYASVRSLAQELRGIGSSRLEQPQEPCATRTHWEAMEQAYPKDAQGRIHATYEVIFGHALAPATTVSDDGVAAVPLAALKRR